MTHTIGGRHVTAQPCDGLAGYQRVYADGTFCGLVAHDIGGWHTLPATRPGHPSPPVCHTPTCRLAVATLIAEVFG